MKVVGLTGGIGSGKTTVAKFFSELSIPVYIADDEAKALMIRSKEVREEITALFGEQAYLKGSLNRKFIAGVVFDNPAKLEALNAIIHPRVAFHFEQWKENQRSPYVIYEAAILFEKGGYKKCDFCILVTADHLTKIDRLKKRDNYSVSEIEARMNNQWSDEKKGKLADFIIRNEELSNTQKEVIKIHEILLQSS